MSLTTGAVVEAPRLNRTFTLGPCLGEGGEGLVFGLKDRPGHVAKIYKQKPDAKAADKIDLLVRASTPAISSFSAWPEDRLHHAQAFAGFMMPAVTGAHPLHELLTPSSRLKVMPSASVSFNVQVAANIARAIAVLHDAGFIVGDINSKNILVRPDATIRFIDIDSIQIGDGRRFVCPVAVGEYTAPELVGKSLSTTPRSKSTDLFALYVLAYQLIAVGYHPFETDLNTDITTAILQHAHVFDTAPGLSSPLVCLSLTEHQLFTPGLIYLLRSAFSAAGEKVARPSAKNLLDALLAMQRDLLPCPNNPRHHRLASQSECPWCASEKRGLPGLFGQTIFNPAPKPSAAPTSPATPKPYLQPNSSRSPGTAQTWRARLWQIIVQVFVPNIMQFIVQIFLSFLWMIITGLVWRWTLSHVPSAFWRGLGKLALGCLAVIVAVTLIYGANQ